MWSRKCENEECEGSQKLIEMICMLHGTSKGNWWRCKTCGRDDSEFTLEGGDYEKRSKVLCCEVAK